MRASDPQPAGTAADAATADTPAGVAPPAGGEPVRPPVYRRRQLVGVAAAALGVGTLSLVVDTAFGYGLLHSWLVFSILGLGFYLVFGVSGQFAFSQGAFFGLGAYASVWASDGRSFAWGLAAAIVLTAVVALAFSLVVVRSNHFYFAIATLAFSHIALVVFREFEAFTAPGGEIVGIAKPDLFGHTFDTGRSLALFLAAFLVLALLLTALIERSPLRREAMAFRDNRQVAATLGVPVLRLRLGMFVLGSTYAGVAGCLFAHKSGFVSPETFSLELGIDIFLIVLLGGVGSMWGPALGAAFVVWAPEQLRFVGEYRALIYGVLLVVVIVAFPKGLVGLVELAWGRVRGSHRPRGTRGPGDRHGMAPAGERA
ncbi:MAG: branched-chain amino acid ABC transporter permease [Acidimicrobiales bacterium]|nr:branched-chain amino acid ABC transporter permease [Acidimicrobiales bacterium]